MHYDDQYHKDHQILRIVIYKHSIGGVTKKYDRNGLLTRPSVSYQVTSIQECHLFEPGALFSIIKDPFKLNKWLSDQPFEKFLELTIKTERYNTVDPKFSAISQKDFRRDNPIWPWALTVEIKDVTNSPLEEDYKCLHG